VSAWVRQLDITQIGQTNEVLDALLDIGPDCLLPLSAELQVRDNFLNKAWQKYWPKLPGSLRGVLPKPLSRSDRRATAAWALGQIGPAARSVTPALVQALDDPEDRVRAEAAQALRFVASKKPEIIEALARRLNDKASQYQPQAASALWDMAPESQAALPELIQLLHIPDRVYLSALCLQELGPLASNAVPALIEVVKRGAAGRPANWTFPVVAGADGKPDGKDHSAHNRAMAAKALGKIGIASREVIETLQTALNYPPTLEGMPELPRPWVCQNAAQALGLLGTNAIAAVPALAQALNETNPAALREVALALGAIGTQARESLPQLKNLFSELPEPFATRGGIGEDRKWELFWLRGGVARAIAQIDNTDKASLAVLLEHADGDYDARRYLEGLGTTMNEFVSELMKKLARTNGLPQAATAELLWHIDPKNTAVVPALRQAMQHTNSTTRACAAYWHWKVTGDSDAAIKIMVAGLKEQPSGASQVFPQWLGRMEAAAEPAVPALKKALWHHNIYTRRNAGKALEKIDPAALDSPKRR
jgi:HEAT repeat protein